MAIPAATIYRVRTGGNENNGGGFVPGGQGVDRSQQDAAHASGANLAVDASVNTDVLPDGHTPDTADVNNIIQITAGAGYTPGAYQIVSIQSGKWRLDRSPAATGTSGGVWSLGGALASPGKAGGLHVGGNTISLAAGTYTMTTNVHNVPGGRIYMAVPPAGTFTRVVGESPINRPVFTRGVNDNESTIVTQGGAIIADLILHGGDYSWLAPKGLLFGNNKNLVHNVKLTSFGGTGAFNSNNYSSHIIDCQFESLGGAMTIGPGLVQHCTFTQMGSGTGSGALTTSAGGTTTFQECLFHTAALHGVRLYANSLVEFHRCLFYGINGDGFFYQSSNGAILLAESCIFENVSGYAIHGTGGAEHYARATNCAYYNLASGFATPEVIQEDTIVGSESFFVDAAAGDFNLNNAAGGGALLRSLTKALAA